MGEAAERKLVTIICPAYNEAAVLTRNLDTLRAHLRTLEDRWRFEVLIVDDGSSDDTGPQADAYAAEHPGVRVVHHPVNMNLGQALRTGFVHARGDWIVVLDVDLSYAPDHVERLVGTLEATRCQIVVASPYMKGGQVTNVPFSRLFLSRWANRFLAYFCHHIDLRTITGMVRGYDRRFLQRLNLKAMGLDINTEIIYKAMLLRGRIIEIPAHLDWTLQREGTGVGRLSSFRVLKSIATYTLSGFTFRPFMFFFVPGLILAALTLYLLGWIVMNLGEHWAEASRVEVGFEHRLSEAVRLLYDHRPHAFFVTGITMIFSVQLMSLGFLAFQAKRYFEELFHLGSPTQDHGDLDGPDGPR
ncbi:MAG: glycosyltransferase family 2 protein [Myxococcales bacterium]|nr:glycosyltransferase family 2 protein [Myxococcales bacterium]